MSGYRSQESQKRLNALRRELHQEYGIRYISRLNSIPKLEAMKKDPYYGILNTYRRYWDLEPYDFRARGITPRRGAWIKWKPLSRYDRQTVRGVGRFDAMADDYSCYVTYPLWVGNGYKNRRIRISIFQVVDYREDR